MSEAVVAPENKAVLVSPTEDHAPPHRPHLRSPVDLLRLIVAIVLVLGGLLVANVFDSTFVGLTEDGEASLESLPAWVSQLPATVLAVTVIAAIGAALVWALVTTRYRRLLLLLLALAGASLLSVALGRLIYSYVDESVRDAFADPDEVSRFRSLGGLVRPGDPLLAVAVAMLGVASSWIRRSIASRLGVVIALYAGISALTSGVPAISLITDVGAGLLVASLILLIFGRHDLAPDRDEIRAALSKIGVDFGSLEHLDVDARGSAPWMGTTSDDEKVFVKALGRDERSADLMFRAYRWVRLRKTGDHRPFVSLRRAVEHEALVSLQAGALGVQTPKIVGVAEAGVDGMILAYEAIPGRSADQLDDISDDALEAIWSMVSELHKKRIAHRDLRLANIFMDDDGEPWLIDFGFSELAASDQLLGTDVAELLSSTAAVVGVERAVRAAHVTTGVHELERALPWLQPMALSTATRVSVGGKKGIEPIRDMLVDQCMISPEPPVKLERVDGKSLFILGTVVLSAWFLLPQLADIDNIWAQVKTASASWAFVAVLFSLVTYVAATASLLGAIPIRVPFLPALLAQLASSFANRVTPARVGGLATNVRYFQKQGVPSAMSITAVGLNAIAGLVVHILLTLGFLLLSGGDENSGGLPIPSPSVLIAALGIVVATIAVSVGVPFTRRLVVEHIVPQLRAGTESMRQIGRSRGRLALLFGGSAVITLAYLGAMVASLEAFGSTASFPVVALLFLTGSAVANAAPTPGGLGATEAALIAAFSLVEEPVVVIPAVFLYRFVTFWLPILPGWLALSYLRQADQL